MSDPDYWRRQYQYEANENTKIREMIKVKLDDPDETVTVEHVRTALRKEYGRGYNSGKEHILNRIKDLVAEDRKALLNVDPDLAGLPTGLLHRLITIIEQAA